jgi:hypothetical protein
MGSDSHFAVPPIHSFRQSLSPNGENVTESFA